ncbi:MAG: hypothetical protein SGILL_008563, partial [Bacillariaceae sp.]
MCRVSATANGKPLLHHLVGGDVGVSLQVFEPITAAAIRINDVDEAMDQIDYAIKTVITEQKPVYLEIPYNIQVSEVKNITPWVWEGPASNPEAVEEAVQKIVAAVTAAERPAALTGVFIERHAMQNRTEELLTNTSMLFATTFDAKAGYLEYLNNCVGFYQGKMSEPEVITAIEGSD